MAIWEPIQNDFISTRLQDDLECNGECTQHTIIYIWPMRTLGIFDTVRSDSAVCGADIQHTHLSISYMSVESNILLW